MSKPSSPFICPVSGAQLLQQKQEGCILHILQYWSFVSSSTQPQFSAY